MLIGSHDFRGHGYLSLRLTMTRRERTMGVQRMWCVQAQPCIHVSSLHTWRPVIWGRSGVLWSRWLHSASWRGARRARNLTVRSIELRDRREKAPISFLHGLQIVQDIGVGRHMPWSVHFQMDLDALGGDFGVSVPLLGGTGE